MGDLRDCVSGDPVFVARWHEICDEADKAKAQWIADLRARGVRVAHPDDGWVDRDKDRLCLCYPQFNDGMKIGSIVALGNPDKYRLVEIIGYDKGILGVEWWPFRTAVQTSQESKST